MMKENMSALFGAIGHIINKAEFKSHSMADLYRLRLHFLPLTTVCHANMYMATKIYTHAMKLRLNHPVCVVSAALLTHSLVDQAAELP